MYSISSAHFSISANGSWPLEQYVITPNYYNSNVLALSTMEYLNLFRFVDNPVNDINNLIDLYNEIDFNYGNSQAFLDSYSDVYRLTSKTKNNTFTWNPSTLRSNNLSIFNNFTLSLCSQDLGDPASPETNKVNYLLDTAYLLYPQRLFLKPIALSANNDGTFNLMTSTVLLSPNVIFLSGNTIEHDSYLNHLNYKITNPNFSTIRGNSIPVNLIYSLSATKNVINTLFTYTPNYNPLKFSVQLEDNNTYIYPDSFNIKYNISVYSDYWANFYSTNPSKSALYLKGIPLGLLFAEEHPDIWFDFRSSFINNFNLNSINYQTIQLTQSAINQNLKLSDISNCILYANLSCVPPTVFSYNNVTYLDQYGNRQPYCKPDFTSSNQNFKIKYIAESPYYFNSISLPISSVQNTTLVKSSSGAIALNTPLADSSTPFDTMIWTIPYPPHYYSFKTSFVNNTFTNPSDTYSLRFNLSTGITNRFITSAINPFNQTEYVYLSSCLASDFNVLRADLPTYAPNDFISIQIADISPNKPIYLSALNCYYGPNLDEVYDLINSPYVPVQQASQFCLVYPLSAYGPFNLTLRTSLSSYQFYHVSQSSNTSYVQFASGYNNVYKGMQGYPITLKVLNENINTITLDSSYLISYPQYPSRNLLTFSDTNTALGGPSLISWNLTSNNIDPTSVITLQSIDTNGNFLSSIPLNQPIPFNPNTWSVLVSGYGPNTVSIALSSQKYNEVALVNTNPNLFNYLYQGKIDVGVKDHQIIGKTYSFNVTAKALVDNYDYSFPVDIPMYWTWSYDGKTTNIPVTAYYNNGPLNGQVYNYGKNDISNYINSLTINFNLSSSFNSYNTHKLLINAFSTNPNAKGSYTVTVNDYPSDSIFNTYFRTAYNYPNSPFIANVSSNNVLTRPNTDLNSFSFYFGEVLQTLNAPVVKWGITDNLGNSTTYISNQSQPYGDISKINYTIPKNVSATYVSLCALSATIAGWYTPYNLIATQTIYTLPSSQFYSPTNFIIYPPYTWQNGNSGYLTMINSNNFTISQAPTAYGHNSSNSQNFYVSANKTATYQYGYVANSIQNSPLTLITPSPSSNNQLIKLNYVNDLSSTRGLTVYLTAYDNFFPAKSINSLNYFGLTSTPSATGIYVGTYPITTNTIPANNNLTYSKNGLSAFNQSPKIFDYDTIQLQFSTVNTAIVFDYAQVTQLGLQFTPVTSIDLDNNVFVGVLQTLTPLNTANTPVRVLQDPNSYVTYSLSSLSGGWVSYINVPMVNGLYDLFILNIGDKSQPLTVEANEQSVLLLNATANLSAYIPSTTYNLASSYTGTHDSWNVISQNATTTSETIVAYTTAVRPEIYISSYYALTGENIFIQFKTPYLQNTPEANISIQSYNIYFGDGLSAYHLVNDTTYHSYKSNGTYNLSYQVNYNNGTSLSFQLPNTHDITIYDSWPTYNQSEIRLLTQEVLTLPWTLEQCSIQPNEYSDADIFNTTMSRLYDNLQYLIHNTQTINTDSPTLFYGWFGTNKNYIGRGIQWHTQDFLADTGDYLNPQYATSTASSLTQSFSSIVDFVHTDDYTFVLDGKILRAFTNGAYSAEAFFDNINQIYQLFKNPVSIDYDKINQNLYILDQYYNKIFKLNLSFGYINEINIQLAVGNYGGLSDPNKFNSPSEIKYSNNNVYVLDYNNHCIKKYTRDLNWVYTYFTDDFDHNIGSLAFPIYNNNPECFAIHPTTSFLYALTVTNKIYVFDDMGNLITNFQILDPLTNVAETRKPIRIVFDPNGNFMYIVYSNEIIKFTLTGLFIGYVDKIPNITLLNNFTSAKNSDNETVLFSTNNSIIKIQDIVTLYKVGEGLPYQYWTEDQILISKNEFTTDNVYNRAFTRLVQNIKTFRNTMDSKFITAIESTPYGQVTYLAKTPILVSSRPVFSNDIENENVQVGVNEFNIPQVVNREVSKIYDALTYLAGYLSVTDSRNLSGINTGCSNPFCWSWQAMSCYNLTLPVIRICNVNPITYAELQSNFPNTYSFSSNQQLTNTWGDATSDCCNNIFYPPITAI